MLAWRILLNTLRPMPSADLAAFILSLPLIVLGIYCVFPHPFYDPDCTFAVLLSILLIQHFALADVSLFGRILVGVSIAIPVFIKQNVGLVFFALTCGALIMLLATIELTAHRRLSAHGAVLLGALIGLVLGILLIESTAGLENYLHWTIDYAAARRNAGPDRHARDL